MNKLTTTINPQIILTSSNDTKPIDIYELIKKFLGENDVKANTKSVYSRQLLEFLNYIVKKYITHPDRSDIIAYREYLLGKKLSIYTISNYLVTVKKFFSWLNFKGIYKNISYGIKVPKKKAGFNKDCLTKDQVHNLLNSFNTNNLDDLRDRAIINLMIRTGLRVVEVTRIDQSDIKNILEKKVLFIHGKNRECKDEIVVLTEKVLGPISEYIKAVKLNENLIERKNTDPLFFSLSTKNFGGRLTTRSISRIVKNKFKSMGLDDDRLTAHSLRHTAITFALLGGETIQKAAKFARHSDLTTILKYAQNINRLESPTEQLIDTYLDS